MVFAGERTLGLLNPASAAPLWAVSHKLPEGAAFRPRARNGVVVCGGQREIGAWQFNNGKEIWRHRASRQLGVPCLHRDLAYFGDGHELMALRLKSGEIAWRFSAIPDTQISYAPVASGDMLLVGPGDGRLYALSAEDGKPRWVLNRIDEWQYLRQLHVEGDVLVAGSYQETLYGIDIASGRQLWDFSAGNFINSHHVAAGSAYLWSPTGWIYAIDIRTGAMRWRHRTTDYRGDSRNWGALMAELVTHGNRLYALDLTNVLHVLSTETGEEIARHALPEAVRPFVLPLSGNALVFGAGNGDLLLAGPA